MDLKLIEKAERLAKELKSDAQELEKTAHFMSVADLLLEANEIIQTLIKECRMSDAALNDVVARSLAKNNKYNKKIEEQESMLSLLKVLLGEDTYNMIALSALRLKKDISKESKEETK